MIFAGLHFFSKIQAIGADPNDSQDQRLQKRLFVSALFLIMLATLMWGSVYIAFGEYQAGGISIYYCAISLISLVVISETRKIRWVLYLHLLLGLLLPFWHTLMLGGFRASSVVILWSLMSPLAALFFLPFRRALPWMLAFPLLLVLTAVVEPAIPVTNRLPRAVQTLFFALNIGSVSWIVLIILNYFISEKNKAYRLLQIEEEKAENLLLNILPKEIAAILKNENRTIADSFEGASILFADLVGFTPLTARMAPVEMVNLLNEIFSYFDVLVDTYGAEKIRTMGDSYMVAAGVPNPHSDHAHALACMALDMEEYICRLPPVDGRPVQFRIGINSGPVVGGVIGRKKFVYDVWGDAVNIASRMESHGIAGKIQVTQATYELIKDDFQLEPRGMIEIKGRGEAQTWFLVKRKPA